MINSTASFQNLGTTSAILPRSKTVTVEGKNYPVRRVPNDNPMVKTFAPTYKDVIIVDGKMYDIQTTPDPFAMDKSIEMVIIDGKKHYVNEGLGTALNLLKGIEFNKKQKESNLDIEV